MGHTMFLSQKQTDKINQTNKNQYRIKAHRDPRILCYIKDLGKVTVCNAGRVALGGEDLASILWD